MNSNLVIGLTKVLYDMSLICVGQSCRFLCRNPIVLFALEHILSTCVFQVRSLHISVPR